MSLPGARRHIMLLMKWMRQEDTPEEHYLTQRNFNWSFYVSPNVNLIFVLKKTL